MPRDASTSPLSSQGEKPLATLSRSEVLYLFSSLATLGPAAHPLPRRARGCPRSLTLVPVPDSVLGTPRPGVPLPLRALTLPFSLPTQVPEALAALFQLVPTGQSARRWRLSPWEPPGAPAASVRPLPGQRRFGFGALFVRLLPHTSSCCFVGRLLPLLLLGGLLSSRPPSGFWGGLFFSLPHPAETAAALGSQAAPCAEGGPEPRFPSHQPAESPPASATRW